MADGDRVAGADGGERSDHERSDHQDQIRRRGAEPAGHGLKQAIYAAARSSLASPSITILICAL